MTTFKYWLKGIRQICDTDKKGNLRKPLGKWFQRPSLSVYYTELIHTTNTHITIQNNQHEWHIFELKYEKFSKPYFHLTSRMKHTTLNWSEYIPIEVERTTNSIKVIQQANTWKPKENKYTFIQGTTTSSLEDYIHHEYSTLKQLTMFTKIINEPLLLNSEDLIASSDGSVKDNIRGSFGLCISNGDTILLECNNSLPTILGNYTSHRSECFGILATLYLLNQIQYYISTKSKPHTKTFTLICDNKAAIDTIKKLRKYKMTTKNFYQPNADILHEILHLIRLLHKKYKTLIILEHIKGHQDRNSNQELSHKATLNIKADNLAAEGMHKRLTQHYKLPTNNCTLFIHNQPVTGLHKSTIKDAYHSIQLRQYIQSKHNWNNTTIENIWWLVHGKAISNFSTSEQITLTKFLHRRMACNEREHRNQGNITNMCQISKDCIETQDHFAQCQLCDKRKQIQKNYHIELSNKMENLGTDADLQRVIIFCISAWVTNQPIPDIKSLLDNSNPLLTKAYKEQNNIGWEHYMRGRLTILWGETYNATKRNQGDLARTADAEKWGKEIITITFRYILNTWYEQNKIEHGDESNKHQIEKEKLTEKIQWLHSKRKKHTNELGEEISQNTLKNLPVSNLLTMQAQMENRNDDCLGTVRVNRRRETIRCSNST